MTKDKLIDGRKIVSRFEGKLVKMIKDVGGNSSKIRKILLDWGYELTKNIFLLTQKIIV